MLKPYVCVACEKVIIAKDEVASLISLFSKFVLAVPAGTEIPKNAVTPALWSVFSMWDPEPGDEHRHYVLCTQLLYPDDAPYDVIARQEMPIQAGARCQMSVQFNGFPIGQTGEYKVHTWLEEDGQKVFGPIVVGVGVEIKH